MPQLAGWVSASVSGGPPLARTAVSNTQRRRLPVSTSARAAAPPSIIGVGSPRRRLNSRATRSGAVTALRSALSPASRSPSSRRNSTDGIDGPTLAQRDDLDAATLVDRGAGVGGAQVDAQVVGHGGPGLRSGWTGWRDRTHRGPVRRATLPAVRAPLRPVPPPAGGHRKRRAIASGQAGPSALYDSQAHGHVDLLARPVDGRHDVAVHLDEHPVGPLPSEVTEHTIWPNATLATAPSTSKRPDVRLTITTPRALVAAAGAPGGWSRGWP